MSQLLKTPTVKTSILDYCGDIGRLHRCEFIALNMQYLWIAAMILVASKQVRQVASVAEKYSL